MSKLQYFNYPGWGEYAKEHSHYAQVVRIGNELRASGQGGWKEDMTFSENEEEQIEQAWANIEKALKHAGVKDPFKNIFSVRSLHVNKHYDGVEYLSKSLKKHFKDHQPIWTMYGVEKLGVKEMMIEIEVCAVVDE